MNQPGLDEIVTTAKSAYLSTKVSGEFVILSLEDEMYYGLDGVSAAIWALIQSPRRLSDVVDAIVARYDVERSVCESDVSRVIGELMDLSLVVRAT